MAFFQLKEYSRGHINRMQHKPINKEKYLKALFWTQVSTTPHKGAQMALFVLKISAFSPILWIQIFICRCWGTCIENEIIEGFYVTWHVQKTLLS